MFRPPHRPWLVLVLALSAAPAVRGRDDDGQDHRAHITARVYPTALLTVDGQPTRQRGAVRRFWSPPLEPGKHYSYTFRAEWMPGNNYETYTVTRKVDVEAGKAVEVDLRHMDEKQGDRLFIRWVPTPPEVVDAMLRLARVGEDDVVYDLGCGRGDIIITAVTKFRARRGVGIDLDDDQLARAKTWARGEGVKDKVELRRQDVLTVNDLGRATVVALYLSDDLNLKLRPRLWEQLRPGTRVVSHRFVMGDWPPDRSETVRVPAGEYRGTYRIHLWTIKEKKEKKEK